MPQETVLIPQSAVFATYRSNKYYFWLRVFHGGDYATKHVFCPWMYVKTRAILSPQIRGVDEQKPETYCSYGEGFCEEDNKVGGGLESALETVYWSTY